MPADMTYEEWGKRFVGDANKTSLKIVDIVNIDENLNYKKIEIYKDKTVIEKRLSEIVLNPVKGYEKNNIYISDKAKVKPRIVHNINKRFEMSIRMLKMEKVIKPNIYIIDKSEMGTTAIASYNFKKNIMYVIPEIGLNDLSKFELTQYFACSYNPLATMLHECIHWKDAMKYRERHGDIDDVSSYRKYLDKKAYRNLEKEGISEYNVGNISEYAHDRYKEKNYDEAEKELIVTKILQKEVKK